jgi:hypothetical protein
MTTLIKSKFAPNYYISKSKDTLLPVFRLLKSHDLSLRASAEENYIHKKSAIRSLIKNGLEREKSLALEAHKRAYLRQKQDTLAHIFLAAINWQLSINKEYCAILELAHAIAQNILNNNYDSRNSNKSLTNIISNLKNYFFINLNFNHEITNTIKDRYLGKNPVFANALVFSPQNNDKGGQIIISINKETFHSELTNDEIALVMKRTFKLMNI